MMTISQSVFTHSFVCEKFSSLSSHFPEVVEVNKDEIIFLQDTTAIERLSCSGSHTEVVVASGRRTSGPATGQDTVDIGKHIIKEKCNNKNIADPADDKTEVIPRSSKDV